jgi:hypothetical protein
MVTLKNVRVEVATYGRPGLRKAAERVLVRLEALCDQPGDTAEITRAHLDQVAGTASDAEELLVIGDLCRLGQFESVRSPARLSSNNDTPVLERTRRISDMIASALDEPSDERR